MAQSNEQHEQRQSRLRKAIELKLKGLKQKDIAQEVGVSQAAISKWFKALDPQLVEEIKWSIALRASEYHTGRGALFRGKFEDTIKQPELSFLKGKVQLVFTSPPFALNRKKRYGNQQGEAYREWFKSYALPLRELLTPDGSLVVELGNAWEPGQPVMSTLALEALLDFKKAGDLHLCQQFVVNNPARLPSPAQWVTVERTRVTDSFTHVWWLSPTPTPKADNRRVLRPYSESMKRLLARGDYNAGRRPSQFVVRERTFLNDNGGAIPHNILKIEDESSLTRALEDFVDETTEEEVRNVINWLFGLSNVLEFPNTSSNDSYHRYCRERNIELHPARMHIGVPTFFVKMLTDPGDLVLDPFAGSNTTGAAAEALGRKWISFEPMDDYIKGSIGRFPTLLPDANNA